jgi:acetylornithine deacetylase
MTVTLTALDRLVGFETPSHLSNLGIIDYIETFLKDRGFRVTRIADQDPGKCGLYAEIGPAGAGIALSGHTDVVPATGQVWTRDPFRLTREGDRFFGRGTTDMKGYLAAMLYAADLAARQILQEPLKLVFSYDEEIGCVGMQRMMDRLGPLIGAPRLCFVGEPTQMQVAVGHKGKSALRAVCHGQSGHSALAPEFVNALHLAADFIGNLRGVQEYLRQNGARDADYDVPYSTVHAGMINGGTALNIVPDRAEIAFEFRHLVTDPAAMIRAQIDAAAGISAAPYTDQWPDARIEIEQINAYPGLDMPQDMPEVGHAMALAQVQAAGKVAFGTEAGLFAMLGIPTVVCGPGDMAGQGHKPDEYITRSQITACEQMMQRIVGNLAGQAT